MGFATAIKYMFGGRKEYLMEFGDSGLVLSYVKDGRK